MAALSYMLTACCCSLPFQALFAEKNYRLSTSTLSLSKSACLCIDSGCKQACSCIITNESISASSRNCQRNMDAVGTSYIHLIISPVLKIVTLIFTTLSLIFTGLSMTIWEDPSLRVTRCYGSVASIQVSANHSLWHRDLQLY